MSSVPVAEIFDFFSRFWVLNIEQLVEGDEETRLWLDTGDEVGGFIYWCDISNKEYTSWRAALLRVWEMQKGGGE